MKITDYWRNASQNYNEVSSHIVQNGYHQNVYNNVIINVGQGVEKKEPSYAVGGHIN